MEKIDSLFYDSIDLLKQMIAIPSHSKEEKAVADMLEKYMRSCCVNTNRKGNNIWTISPDFNPNKPTILLNSHIDTIKPVSGWTVDPYEAIESEEKITGLGSNDAGASVVSLLHAFIILTKKEQPNNLIFLASCEEEISGNNGVESILPELPSITFGLVGEPTGMNPAIAEKGLMVLDCYVRGKSGHAAREDGDNAIYKAIPCINWFKMYEFPKQSDLLGKIKMNVTMIQSGTQHNVIPDLCTFVVDVRSNECYSNVEILDIISQNCGCEIKARSTRLNSSWIPKEHPVVQRAIMLGKKSFGSPTLSDQALMPFPTLKIGPGESSRSHTADEFIKPQEIREAIEIYVRLLDQLVL
ncbi:MAG: M20 family metallo-hydrolase [Candidatus Azobacteroides sp.]|nr:M20 family metallo-hydrolase [Candidatus Azobacteroides sp.]